MFVKQAVKFSRKAIAVLLGLLLALSISIAVTVRISAKAETPSREKPNPDAAWSFTELGDGGAATDTVGTKNLTATSKEWGAPVLVADSKFTKVMPSESFANNKWGDQSCPWYLDVNANSYTLSAFVKLNPNRNANAVIFSDLITGLDGGATTHSWCVWVKGDGTIEFMKYDNSATGDKWSAYWNLGTMPSDKWVEFTLVFDNENNKITSYIDNKKGNEKTVGAAEKPIMLELADSDKNFGQAGFKRGFQIGRDGSGNQGNIQGTFADVKLYNVALKEYQIDPDAEIPTDPGTGGGEEPEEPLKTPPANALDNPLGAWDFIAADETENANSTVKAINDLSGSKKPLIAEGRIKYVDDAKFTRAVTAKTYYYHLNGGYDINNGFTISAWVNASSLKANTFLMSNATYEFAGGKDQISYDWDIHINSEGRLAFETKGGGVWFPITGNDGAKDVLTTKEWTHIAVSYDAEKGEMYGFINGVQKTGAAVSLPSNFVKTSKIGGLVVGTMANNIVGVYNDAYAFPGQIAKVRIYDTAFNAAVVSGIMNGTDLTVREKLTFDVAESLPSSNLTGAWNATEGEGEFVNDISGKNNHAILGTGVSWVADMTEKYESVINPGYAVTAATIDMSKDATIAFNVKINAAHNGFGTMIASRSEARPHELGYLGKDFYIDSNPSRWNFHVNTIGKMALDCQGAWDLDLIEVPYVVIPSSVSEEKFISVAITVEKPTAAQGLYTYRFYIDGYLVFTAQRAKGIAAPETGDSMIFVSNADAGNNLQGNLAEMRFYDKRLSDAEIRKQAQGDNIATPDKKGLIVAKKYTPSEITVGEELSINISEFITNDAWPTVEYDAYITNNVGEKIGKIENGVFKFKPTHAKDYAITIAAKAGIQHESFSFTLKAKAAAAADPGSESGGCGSETNASILIVLLGLIVLSASIVIIKRKAKKD